MRSHRTYAVGLVHNSRLVKILRHLTQHEATGYVRGYNTISDGRHAVLMSQPICRAMSAAVCKSRAS